MMDVAATERPEATWLWVKPHSPLRIVDCSNFCGPTARVPVE